jgi:hypothetical protein
MPAILFRCPFTGRTVQSWIAEEVTADDVYVGVHCPACTRSHLVNPTTARVLGVIDKPEK